MAEKIVWQEVARWTMTSPDWRFWTIGLSTDGKYCLVFWWDNSSPVVYGIDEQKVVWNASNDPLFFQMARKRHVVNEDEFEDWLWLDWLGSQKVEAYLHIDHEPIKGQYRLLGMTYNFPKKVDDAQKFQIALDIEKQQIIFTSLDTNAIRSLDYCTMAEDWEVSSFSDNDSTVVVLESSCICFYRQIV